MPCRLSHVSNIPGNPDQSTALSQLSKSMQVYRMDDVSLRVLLDTLPRLFSGFPVMAGIAKLPALKQKASFTFPLFSTSDLDLAGLKTLSFSSLCSIHLQPGTKSVGQISSWALCTLARSRFLRACSWPRKTNHWDGAPCDFPPLDSLPAWRCCSRGDSPWGCYSQWWEFGCWWLHDVLPVWSVTVLVMWKPQKLWNSTLKLN